VSAAQNKTAIQNISKENTTQNNLIKTDSKNSSKLTNSREDP